MLFLYTGSKMYTILCDFFLHPSFDLYSMVDNKVAAEQVFLQKSFKTNQWINQLKASFHVHREYTFNVTLSIENYFREYPKTSSVALVQTCAMAGKAFGNL